MTIKQTPLAASHIQANAKMVDFGGWEMPLHYGSQIEEHHAVRQDAGMFDVSHMTIVDVSGEGVDEFLKRLLANNIDRLKSKGKALYTCMLNEQGGVLDDLIVYNLEPEKYRIVFNAATRDKVMDWIHRHKKGFYVSINERDDLTMLAVQGPNARAKVEAALPAAVSTLITDLAPFHSVEVENMFIARTGYTGEDGYELMLPTNKITELWDALAHSGVRPIGLGARDTLRLEAGMNLYGADMNETVNPLESGLGWTISWEPAERNFIGRVALEKKRKDKNRNKLVGLVLETKGVLRNHQKVMLDGQVIGEITSGSFSPTMGLAIALARVPRSVSGMCQVELRGKPVVARIVTPPFVRNGKICVELDHKIKSTTGAEEL
ncbi:MAG: glycine cleavage system aminomethyltransferase GcvT [Gammaproteobacteria bacterium]|nr:glycine cleavage system aminomethyltransferase GcvT [Gammaproteobacteria bacterium]